MRRKGLRCFASKTVISEPGPPDCGYCLLSGRSSPERSVKGKTMVVSFDRKSRAMNLTFAERNEASTYVTTSDGVVLQIGATSGRILACSVQRPERSSLRCMNDLRKLATSA
jgi:hypothetical protein